MIVAFLTGRLSGGAGGVAKSIPLLVRELEKGGNVAIHIIGIKDPSDLEAWRSWSEHVHAHTAFGPRTFHWAPALGNTLEKLNADLVDAQGLWMYQSLVNLRRFRRTRKAYMVTPRGMLDPWALRRAPSKKHLVAWCFENEHLHYAACLRATSMLEARHFRRYGLRNPIAVVSNGVDVPPLAAETRNDNRVRRILFLSRLHPKKGLDILLRAWATLTVHYPGWELFIAGPDEVGHRMAMERLAKELDAPNVTWSEAVHGAEKSALYWSAELFVLPTHSENFGNVIAEALAHGVPVVTTTGTPWPGIREHGCGWWIELSERDLVKALREAMALSDAERQGMGARGRAWMARDFGWPAIAQQMLQVYEWVLGGGPPPACVITD